MSTCAVIVSYHTGDILWSCLDAAVRDCDEVVVVDNGNPTDVTARLSNDDRIIYLGGHGNIGFASACNRGARLATADHILILNPDAVLEQNCVGRLIAASAKRTGPAILGARLIDRHGHELRGSRRRQLSPLTIIVGRNLHRKPLPDRPIRVGAVSGAAMLIPREDWAMLGGFDDRYFLHVEDLDICRRVQDLGGACIFVPNAEVVHEGATSDAPNWIVETHKTMGFRRYLTTYYPWTGRIAFAAMLPILRRRMRRSRGE